MKSAKILGWGVLLFSAGIAGAVALSSDTITIKPDGPASGHAVVYGGGVRDVLIVRNNEFSLSQQFRDRRLTLCLLPEAPETYEKWLQRKTGENPGCRGKRPMEPSKCRVKVFPKGKKPRGPFKKTGRSIDRTFPKGKGAGKKVLEGFKRSACQEGATLIVDYQVFRRGASMYACGNFAVLLDEQGRPLPQPGRIPRCDGRLYQKEIEQRCKTAGRNFSFVLPAPEDTQVHDAPPKPLMGGIVGHKRYFNLKITGDKAELVRYR